MNGYDVETSTIVVADRHPCEIWRPRGVSAPPLIVFSHAAGQGRRSATFLCHHLATRGYLVAAMDHSEVVDPQLARPASENDEEKLRRWNAVIDRRVPDVRALLDHLLRSEDVDATRIGIAGHSFGGWTALAALEHDDRFRAVVALAPAGASNPKPGVLPVSLTFRRFREVPALYVAAANDSSIPLAGVRELFERSPGPKQLFVLNRADHMHFMDGVEARHEGFRTAPAANAELAAMQRAMLPFSELMPAADAQRVVCAMAAAHFDCKLLRRESV